MYPASMAYTKCVQLQWRRKMKAPMYSAGELEHGVPGHNGEYMTCSVTNTCSQLASMTYKKLVLRMHVLTHISKYMVE